MSVPWGRLGSSRVKSHKSERVGLRSRSSAPRPGPRTPVAVPASPAPHSVSELGPLAWPALGLACPAMSHVPIILNQIMILNHHP
jgi:hypothetical protein